MGHLEQFKIENSSEELLVTSIKNAWQHKQVLSVLFLDISGAFPSTVTTQLLKNLCARPVPTAIVVLVMLVSHLHAWT
jgi:hypothetical protein